MGSGGTEKIICMLSEMLINAGNNVVVCAAGGESVIQLQRVGAKYVEIPDMQNKSFKAAWTITKTICQIIDTEDIDIVHTHHRMAAFYMRIIKQIKHIGTLNTIHNTFDDKVIMTKIAFNKTYNIAVGNSVKENMIQKFGIKPEKVHVIYNAIDSSNFINERIELVEKMRDKNYFIVGNIGRINTQKGFEYYVEAAEIIKKENIPIRLLVIGDGVLQNKISDLVKEKRVEDYVIFTGYQKNILNYIQNIDLVVLSSLWEGFPLIPIEAFSMGKTVVATDVPGTVEIVEDDYNGIIVPSKDGTAIARAIIKLYTNNGLRERLEMNALRTYKEKYSFDAFCESYFKVYEKIYSEKKIL